MFDIDKWQEIAHTIRRNKLRTFLTMFGVFWGIFMLLLLLGSGAGLENGVKKEFSKWATNSFFVWSGRTTMPYKGLKPGRWLHYTLQDWKAVKERAQYVEIVVPRNRLGGWRGTFSVTRNSKSGGFTVSGDHPEFGRIKTIPIEEGRWLNALDMKEKRKVAVIGWQVVEELFERGEEPIGDYVKLSGVYFKVVGITRSVETGDEADQDNRSIYTPFTTFQQAFNFGNGVGSFAAISAEGIPAAWAEAEMKQILGRQQKVHPEDLAAIQSANVEEQYNKVNSLFIGIRIFMWVVGIGTLAAGMIGVSNIMLIIVKERTKEIGIRKAIGATPWSIISLILQESVVLTIAAGYMGLLIGLGLIEMIGSWMESSGASTGMFSRPEVDLSVAIASLGILIIGGILAGWLPAQKAVSVSPIEAIREE
jgi:putative ABC transport system permease protein